MRILILLTITICLFSCHKIRDKATVTLSYKADGNLIQYSGDAGTPDNQGIIGIKQLQNGPFQQTLYLIDAINGTNNAAHFGIQTDSLLPGNYRSDSLSTFIGYSGKIYPATSTQLDISITRYSNGSIDGTFSGELYIYDPQIYGDDDSVKITEGQFKNIRILY